MRCRTASYFYSRHISFGLCKGCGVWPGWRRGVRIAENRYKQHKLEASSLWSFAISAFARFPVRTRALIGWVFKLYKTWVASVMSPSSRRSGFVATDLALRQRARTGLRLDEPQWLWLDRTSWQTTNKTTTVVCITIHIYCQYIAYVFVKQLRSYKGVHGSQR